MATWSSRRKFIYGGSIIAVILLIIFSVFFSIFYKSPTCTDGIRNGGEQDVDCGGKCIKLCQSAFLPAKIKWGGGKYEKIADGLYNVASYIINPNTGGAAVSVPYKFTLYDEAGILITEKRGVVTLPAHRNALAFESAVNVGKRNLSKVTFEFTKQPQWFKSHDSLNGLSVLDKKYAEEGNGSYEERGSSLEVTLENRNLLPYNNITVSAVLYDNQDNAIGFSRTKIDSINSQEPVSAFFTWPSSRQGKVTSIEIFPSSEAIRDR